MPDPSLATDVEADALPFPFAFAGSCCCFGFDVLTALADLVGLVLLAAIIPSSSWMTEALAFVACVLAARVGRVEMLGLAGIGADDDDRRRLEARVGVVGAAL